MNNGYDSENCERIPELIEGGRLRPEGSRAEHVAERSEPALERYRERPDRDVQFGLTQREAIPRPEVPEQAAGGDPAGPDLLQP